MTNNQKANKAHLEKRWQDAIDALAELANLHTWLVDRVGTTRVLFWGHGRGSR